MSHIEYRLVSGPEDLSFAVTVADLISDARKRDYKLPKGSDWGRRELKAFHVVVRSDLELRDVVPENLLPTSPQELGDLGGLLQLEGDGVRDDETTGVSWRFYEYLQEVVSHASTESLASQTSGSDISHTTDEEKPEVVSELLAHTLVAQVLKFFCPDIVKAGKVFKPTVSTPHSREELILFGNAVEAEIWDDGSIKLVRHATPEKRRTGKHIADLTLACFEAKRYRKSSLGPDFSGQVFAECLGMAYRNLAASQNTDQEAFLIGMHHRFAYIVHVVFPWPYLDTVMREQVKLPDDMYVILKQTKMFDLLWRESRWQFIRGLVAMCRHFAATNNLVGRLRFGDLSRNGQDSIR